MSKMERSPTGLSRRCVLRAGASLAGVVGVAGVTRGQTKSTGKQSITAGRRTLVPSEQPKPTNSYSDETEPKGHCSSSTARTHSGNCPTTSNRQAGRTSRPGRFSPNRRTLWDYAFPYVALDEPGDYEMRISAEVSNDAPVSNDEPMAYYVYRYCEDRQGSGPPLVGHAKTGITND